MTDLDAAREQVRERVDSLPDAVWHCERCETAASMQIRRSSLNDQFLADDVGLKCAACRYFATHGIPFDDPAQFEYEYATLRGGQRVLDFGDDGPHDDVAANLRALGYMAAATEADK